MSVSPAVSKLAENVNGVLRAVGRRKGRRNKGSLSNLLSALQQEDLVELKLVAL